MSDSTAANTAPLSIVFLGAGNMGGALIEGLLRPAEASTRPGIRVGFVETSEGRAAALQERFPELERLALESASTGLPAVHDRLGPESTLVLAVKPQGLDALESNLQALHPGIVVSVMAGIPLQRLRTIFAPPTVLVRSMPNTPALIGLGMTGLVSEAPIDATTGERIAALFAPVGTLRWFDDEDQLHAVTALSGSGPAYVFRFAEALTRAGIELGLAADDASLLARRTLLGAASMAADEPDLASLRAQVTSPGGTTAAGLARLDHDQAIDRLLLETLQAAAARSRELAGPPRET